MTAQEKRAFSDKWLSAWSYSDGEIETLFFALDGVSAERADAAMRRMIALKEDRMKLQVGSIIRAVSEHVPSAISEMPGDGDSEWNNALVEWIEAARRYGPNAPTANARKLAEAWCAWVDYHRAKCGARYTDEYRRADEARAAFYWQRAEAEAAIATAQAASRRPVREPAF